MVHSLKKASPARDAHLLLALERDAVSSGRGTGHITKHGDEPELPVGLLLSVFITFERV